MSTDAVLLGSCRHSIFFARRVSCDGLRQILKPSQTVRNRHLIMRRIVCAIGRVGRCAGAHFQGVNP